MTTWLSLKLQHYRWVLHLHVLGKAMPFTLLFLSGCSCMVGCSGAQKPAGCTAADEAAVDAQFQADLVEHCAKFTPVKQPTECPDYERIEREYKKRSQEWYVRCHP